MQAKSLKLSSGARLMRGTLSSHVPGQHSWPATAKNLPPASFLNAMVPLIRQPFGLPPSPGGKAKDQPFVKNTLAAERRMRDHGSYRRSHAYTPFFGQ